MHHANVALSRALPVLAYIVTSRATPAILNLPALKPMALLQTMRHANVALLRALPVQDYIVTSLATPVVLSHHALKPMA